LPDYYSILPDKKKKPIYSLFYTGSRVVNNLSGFDDFPPRKTHILSFDRNILALLPWPGNIPPHQGVSYFRRIYEKR
jgi:hypothetical protein